MAQREPDLARKALKGLALYQQADAPSARPLLRAVANRCGASLRDCGGSGPTLVLVPSLINPPTILDLDRQRSLARALSPSAHVLLLDWGPASERAELDLSEHVTALLLPLVEEVGGAILVGYCLGGTLALEAARRSSSVRAVATLASPWRFAGYSDQARSHLREMWTANQQVSSQLGGLPMEVLQTAFWALDPQRTVAKFARYAELEPGSEEARAFVTLEDWANGGEPLPVPAGRELVEDLFGADRWRAASLPDCPTLHITAAGDRIVPAETAAPGPRLASSSGHVGMIVGRKAASELHQPLLSWLEGLVPRR